MKALFFTGAGGVGNEAVFRLLKRKYNIIFGDAVPENINKIIPKKNIRKIPFANQNNFVNEIKKIYKDDNIDLIIPAVDEELEILADQKMNIFLPDKNFIKNMISKDVFVETLKENGISYPKTGKVDFDWLDYPCILKPKKGRGSRGVEIIKSRDKLKSYLEYTGLNQEEYILQELLNGQEYTILMSANKNNKLLGINLVKVKEKKGITISAETSINKSILKFCKDFHKKIPTRGCYNIQLIHCNDGKIVPFEVNPRISTTLCLAIYSGIDPIENFYKKNNIKLSIGNKSLYLKRFYINNIGEI